MRRILFAFALLGSLAPIAAAQPEAPPAPPAPPSPPVAETPPTPPTPPTAPTPPAPPEAPAVSVVVEPKADKPAEPAPAKKIAVGKGGFLTPGVLMQGWFILDHAGDKIFTDTDGTNRATDTTSAFRLRRAEISAKGEILPKRVGFQVMFDPAKVREMTDKKITLMSGETITVKQPVGAISVLQDFYITYLSKYADISGGQFKIPVSWEGLNSSAKIIMPERALISQLFGDKRDLGLRIAKQFPKWGYHVGIYNGVGLNNLDNNNQKDVALRLEAYPVKGLTLAGVTYDSVGYRDRAGTKDRWELDARYEGGPYLFQAEYIEGRDVKAENADALKARGFYAAFGYTLKDKSFKGELQPIVRVGYVDPNASKNLDPKTDKDDELWHYDVGVNYYLQGHEMKLQAAYQRKQFETAPAVNELILAAQVWY